MLVRVDQPRPIKEYAAAGARNEAAFSDAYVT